MKLVKDWYQSIRIGMLSTLNVLNFRQKLSFLWSFITGKTTKEFVIKGGTKYPDKTFFIIRRDNSKVGLFSMYITNAGYIKYALERGYIPVVDMQHYANCYLEQGELGSKNAWDFYFLKNTDISLNEVYKAKNIILSSLSPLDTRPNDHMSFFDNKNNELTMWRDIAKHQIKIKEDIWKEAKKRYELETNGKRCLGVSIRGTDYIKLEPPEHPIQPSVDRVISDAKAEMKANNCEKLYLCTEDAGIVDAFKKEFGDICFTNTRRLFGYSEGSIIEKKLASKINRYEDGKEYLITILMLSLTDVLLASRASGTVAAEMISNGWEFQKIYDLGRYPKRSK